MSLLLTKKTYKKNPISAAIVLTPAQLTGGVLFFGKIGCLDEDMEILYPGLKLSYKKIKDLPEKCEVVSYNFDTKKKSIKSAEKVYSGEKECFEVLLENGSIVLATEEHIFFLKDGTGIKLKDLKEGDKILSGKGFSGLTHKWGINGENNPSKRKEVREKISYKKKIWYKNNPSGKETARKMGINNKGNKALYKNFGDSNKVFTKERREKIRKAMLGENNNMFGRRINKKAKFIKELNHYVRSNWEKKFCLFLKKKNITYEYEPDTFKLRIDGRLMTYTPDIKINKTYIEIKGPIWDMSIKKMKCFIKDHPGKRFIIISNTRNFKNLHGFKFLYDFNKIINGDIDINAIIKD